MASEECSEPAPTLVSGDRPGPLARFKVLDLTHARSGPSCVRVLADWGADVIRVEQPPSLEDKEEIVGARRGFDYQNLHRNKRSVTLNLKTEEGRDVFRRLVEDSDVLVENMRPSAKYRLEIDYESLRKVNPRLVYGSISGFGQDGPYRDWPGVDQIAQGMGGLMSVTGSAGQGPMRAGIALADLASGAFLAQGLLIALLERETSGLGRWVQTSLLEAQIALLDFQAARWLIAGEVSEQRGNEHPTSAPTAVFATLDGHINIAASGQRLFERLCDAIGRRELVDDPRYLTFNDRSKNREPLLRSISDCIRHRTSKEWVELLNKAGVPCGPIYAIDEVFQDPQVRHLKMALPVDHSELGRLNLVAQPFSFSDSSRSLRAPTPDVGEHTIPILRELGFDDARIQELTDKRVV